jgi:hypothetical protein
MPAIKSAKTWWPAPFRRSEVKRSSGSKMHRCDKRAGEELTMQPIDVRRDSTRELARPGPIGSAIRVILGAALIYWAFVPLLTKWNVFLEHDPIESERYYTLFTLWMLPYVFNFTFRRRWGPWPTVVFVAGGAALGLVGYLVSGEFWNPVLAGWVYAGDFLVMAALAVSFPVAVATRSPGCELGAIPWLIARRGGRIDASPRPGCAVGLDHLDRWEATRRRRA